MVNYVMNGHFYVISPLFYVMEDDFYVMTTIFYVIVFFKQSKASIHIKKASSNRAGFQYYLTSNDCIAVINANL